MSMSQRDHMNRKGLNGCKRLNSRNRLISKNRMGLNRAVQQAHNIRAREEEAAKALISIGMAGEEVTREQGIQTETDTMEQVQELEKRNSELKKENTDLRKRLLCWHH